MEKTIASNKELGKHLLYAAEAGAAKAIEKVNQLRLAAEQLKILGVKHRKLTKAQKIASDASDGRALLEYIKASEDLSDKRGNCSGTLPSLALPCVKINPPSDVKCLDLSDRKQLIRPGTNLVMVKGSFAIPQSFRSGNCHIDSMNMVLFDVYMEANDMLDMAQAAEKFTMSRVLRAATTIEDSRAAICILRTAAHKIRSVIIDIGGLPLREPAAYWRAAFPDAMV